MLIHFKRQFLNDYNNYIHLGLNDLRDKRTLKASVLSQLKRAHKFPENSIDLSKNIFELLNNAKLQGKTLMTIDDFDVTNFDKSFKNL